MCVCLCACVLACVRECVRACVRACVRVCVLMNCLTCDENGAIEMQHNNNYYYYKYADQTVARGSKHVQTAKPIRRNTIGLHTGNQSHACV